MKTVVYIWTLVLWASFSTGLHAQSLSWQSAFEKNTFEASSDSSAHLLALLVASDATVTDSSFAKWHEELSAFGQQLAKKRKKFLSESHFLYYVFKQVQQRYLHHYQPYPLFTSLQDSTYNCVSGTALYAWLLNQLGFSTQIRETNVHVYLRVRTVKSEYLIDATDPENGFVSDDETLIARREMWYASNEVMRGKPYNKAVTLAELAGLQYFNEAVKAFNRRSYERCMQHLAKADKLYAGSVKVANLRSMAQPYVQPVWTAAN